MTKNTALWLLGLLCLVLLIATLLLGFYLVAGPRTDAFIQITGGGFATSVVSLIILRWHNG